MRFPYGSSDFYDLITEDYLYVDRTDRIPLLEAAAKSILLLRPRRFGKSLLLSMQENYYDIAKANEFERLFGHFAIGQNPTPLHNQYLILRWDFSVVTSKPTYEEQQQVLTDYLNAEIRIFQSKYQHLLTEKIEIDERYATGSLWSALNAVQRSGHRLYLLIDEYDNFANDILMGRRPTSQERYEALVFGEGEFKGVFKAVKAAMAGRGLDRTFIVGVSPIALHDVSSGYNIATNIYFREEFNDLCGFTEDEVTTLLQQVVEQHRDATVPFDEAHALMRTYYNGSRFSDEGGEHIDNPTSTFYFLDHLQRTGRYPRRLLDSNLAPDHDKIAYVARLTKGEEVILNIVDETEETSVVELEDRFGVKEMLAESNTTTFMLSLLYYLGVLTLDGKMTMAGELRLRIPNLIMRHLYVERLQKLLLPHASDRDRGQEVAKMLYSQGSMQPLCAFIEQQIFPVFSNRAQRAPDIDANELTIKTAFLTLLSNDTFHMVDSELPLRRGYADLTMILRPEMRQYQLLEFKYLKLSDLGLAGQEVRETTTAELLALEPIQSKFAEAREQGQTYGATLQGNHRHQLKLRTFAVVAIGFDRLLWEEISI